MPRFKQPLPEISDHDFDHRLCVALGQLSADELGLERALRSGNAVDYRSVLWTVSGKSHGDPAQIRAGVFFNSMIAGCSCADDPGPADLINEFCEALITLDEDRNGCEIDFV